MVLDRSVRRLLVRSFSDKRQSHIYKPNNQSETRNDQNTLVSWCNATAEKPPIPLNIWGTPWGNFCTIFYHLCLLFFEDPKQEINIVDNYDNDEKSTLGSRVEIGGFFSPDYCRVVITWMLFQLMITSETEQCGAQGGSKGGGSRVWHGSVVPVCLFTGICTGQHKGASVLSEALASSSLAIDSASSIVIVHLLCLPSSAAHILASSHLSHPVVPSRFWVDPPPPSPPSLSCLCRLLSWLNYS